MEVRENPKDKFVCPACGYDWMFICADYCGRHTREVLVECGNEKCDRLFKIYYKFDRIVELKEA